MDDPCAVFISGGKHIYFAVYIFRSGSRDSVAKMCIWKIPGEDTILSNCVTLQNPI